MERLEADVVVIGSGVAGALVACRLSRAGLRTLVLEAGPRIERADAVERFQKALVKSGNSPYPDSPHAPHPDESRLGEHYANMGPLAFRGTYTRVVGGTTWHWDGTVARFRPDDLRLRSRFGVGLDWPLDYDELGPWYEEAERELGVAGDESSLFSDLRRGAPYPMEAVPLGVLDKFARGAAEKAGLRFASFPQARNTRDYQGRPACCGNNSCVPVCPVQAKYDATVHVEEAEALGARVVVDAVVHALEPGADRRIALARFRRPDGGEGEAVARVFVLAAHAVESAKLLLLSRSEAAPEGVANGSGQVGRNLMGRLDRTFLALAPTPVYPYRGPGETACIVDGRDGGFRESHAAFGVNWNAYGWSRALGPLAAAERAIRDGLRGEALVKAIRAQIHHEVVLTAGAEILPDPANRIEPDESRRDGLGIPLPRVTFGASDYTLAGLDAARVLQERLLAAMGCTAIRELPLATATGIMGGTIRMGGDPRSSVVDADQRAHEHDNLFVLGSATFPTLTPTPPTLTIAALALRAAPAIASRFRG